MDYYKCNKCGKIFDESETNFCYVADVRIALCGKCNKLSIEEEAKYLAAIKEAYQH